MGDPLVMTETALLTARELSVRTGAGARARTLVDRLSFTIGTERLALIGESGAGKSLTARALVGLLAAPLTATATELRFGDTDLLRLRAREWARLRGSRLSLALQDPRFALNPVLTIGKQLDEAVRLHGTDSYAERQEKIAAILPAVGLDGRRILGAYPQQLSGGMGQRVVLAMMLVNHPKLLIADEPTSALDAETRDQVFRLICDLAREQGMGVLLISHDLQQVARYCDRALIMFRGRIVDECPAAALGRSTHPYTRALWSCRPSGRTFGTQLPVLDPNWQAAQ
jgi:peptide/nickel transport system ATP-binding protein